MLLQMSGPPGVHAQLPAGRAGRAEAVSVLLLHSPPSAPDPCARTGHVITQLSALVSPWLILFNVAEGEKKKNRESCRKLERHLTSLKCIIQVEAIIS